MLKKNFHDIVKYNDKLENKANQTYLWDAESVAIIILNNMIEEAGKNFNRYNGLASFIAYRLKFADEKTIRFMQDAIFKKEKHFTEKISGDYNLYETMQINSCDYFQALLTQYEKTEHAKKSKFTCEYFLPDISNISEPFKTKCSKLSEDGKTIIYMKQEDWEKEFGPVIVIMSKENRNNPKMQEWINKFGQPIGPNILRSSGEYRTPEERKIFLEEINKKLEAMK